MNQPAGTPGRLPIEQLHTFPGNPRRGNIDAIAQSLAAHGQYKPILVNIGTHTGRPHEVLAGNHTLLAAQQLGYTDLDVWLIDVNEHTAQSIVAADNRIADLGDYDPTDLYSLLSALDGQFEGTGYDTAFLEQLRHQLYPPETFTDPDDAPDLPAEPMSQLGQTWLLGDHRLLVGDATDQTAVHSLVADSPPDCLWTDPPYGVDYVGKTSDALTIRNDAAGGLDELLTAAFTVAATVCRPGAPIYVAHADTHRPTVEAAMRQAGLLVRQNLIWHKSTIVMGHSDYHYRHEPILYGFTPGTGRLGRGGRRWYGGNTQSSVFEYPKPARSSEHPTMKPVALIEAMLANSCPPQGTVLDLFAGSGSTLIAAHRRGMRCLAVEIDPRYADVIITRFQDHTGTVAKLES